ncbi:MAG: UDP-2,3-diacylglucosamine diphosphatase [Caldimonas sp.]
MSSGQAWFLPDATPTFTAPPDWRAIDFISDLHIAQGTPRVFDAWATHLHQTRADAIFILGDLFEMWIGDDIRAGSFESRCVEVLREASRSRTVAFMPGNRDFLVGDAMLQSSGVMRLADPTIVVAFGARLLASHGDALCLGDVGYQRYRTLVRRSGVQSLFLALPRSAREAVGRAMRRRGDRPCTDVRRRVDLDSEATRAWMQQAQTPTLVHGHTHAPACHEVAPGTVRHVMTDWHLDNGLPERAEVLRWSADGFARIAPETGTRP